MTPVIRQVSAAARSPHPQWDSAVVVVGTCFWDGTPLLERHIAAQLTKYSRVLYVEPPTSVLSRYRNRESGRVAPPSGLRMIHDRLAVLGPRLPPLKDQPWAKGLSLRIFQASLRRTLVDLGSPLIRATIVTSLDPLLHVLSENVSVYYAKDDYTAGADLLGMPRRLVDSYVERLCQEADALVAVSPHLTSTLSKRGFAATTIPNGCDPKMFEATGVPSSAQTPLAAFVGHLSDRVDLDLLEAVVGLGVPLRIIGPKQETLTGTRFESLLRHPRVQWLGPVSYDKLPHSLTDVTTCLLPYSPESEFNLASFPLKLLEYLAAGRRVVSTNLPAVAWLDTELIVTADGAAGFADAVASSLSRPLAAEEIGNRKRFASAHSWAERTARLAAVIGLVGETP